MRLSLILSVLLSSAVAIGATPIMDRWISNDAGGNKDLKRDLDYHPLRREGPRIVAAREASMNDSPNVSELLRDTKVNQREDLDARDSTSDGSLFPGGVHVKVDARDDSTIGGDLFVGGVHVKVDARDDSTTGALFPGGVHVKVDARDDSTVGGELFVKGGHVAISS